MSQSEQTLNAWYEKILNIAVRLATKKKFELKNKNILYDTR